jgi:hypothetical protein
VLVGAANYAYADGPSKGVVTVLQGLEAALGKGFVSHVDGCEDTPCDTADIDAATALSKGASATVLVLGDSFGGKREGWPLCKGSTTNGCESEAHDRTTIEIPGKQADVATALAAASVSNGAAPLVCVLLHGGAIALGAALDACDAIVDLWVPGQEGGSALAGTCWRSVGGGQWGGSVGGVSGGSCWCVLCACAKGGGGMSFLHTHVSDPIEKDMSV